MAIEFNCPHCGVLYKLKDELAGKTGKCKNPKCLKPILIPFRSTVGANAPLAAKPIDAEALAAAAFAEEKPPPEIAAAAAAPTKKLPVTCNFCDHKFEVDAAMGGKNAPCPECSKIVRVPKPVENKPADWRTAATNKPSLAKATEPAPAGVWDAQVKGVSGESLRKAGALAVEDEEEPRDRRLRRLKQICIGLALLGMVAFTVIWISGSIRANKQERWMDKAVKEMENKEEGSKKPEFQAAIQRFAGEYHVRAAQNPDELQAALVSFNKALDLLQKQDAAAGAEPIGDEIPKRQPAPDRDAMLVELGISLVVCGPDVNDSKPERRLPWDQVQARIRKCLDKVPVDEVELRTRSLRLLTRKLAERGQGPLVAVNVARSISRNIPGSEDEQPELIGRVGIELFLLGKKDQAKQVLDKAPAGAQPALTALWLALGENVAKADFQHLPPPPTESNKEPDPKSVLAYAEGRALQGRWDDALKTARLAVKPGDRVDALVHIAVAALDLDKADTAGVCVEEIVALVNGLPKETSLPPWLLARAAELAARAGKLPSVQPILDAIHDDTVRSWARLYVLRNKLAGQPKQKADESWLESIAQPEEANLAQALAQAEVARHNAAAGESSYTRVVEALPKGIIRPFGYAGTALGIQDRAMK